MVWAKTWKARGKTQESAGKMAKLEASFGRAICDEIAIVRTEM